MIGSSGVEAEVPQMAWRGRAQRARADAGDSAIGQVNAWGSDGTMLSPGGRPAAAIPDPKLDPIAEAWFG